MTINKISIAKNISKKVNLTQRDGKLIVDKFLQIIISKSKLNQIKISGFGSFKFNKTPERIGRNPKTKEPYVIQSSKKLSFYTSNKIKQTLN